MKSIFLIIFLFYAGSVNSQNNIRISSDFPGGNIIVQKLSKDTVWVEPDLSFTKGKWFYWYFKVSNISAKRITFKFEKNNVFTKYGPAYSINNDNTWKWYGENRIANGSFTFSFAEQDTLAYFSVAFPYTEKNFYKFLANLRNSELLKIDTLCLSPENRIIEKIVIHSLTSKPLFKVLITARHHACEMIANYLLEGIIESILNEEDLEFLRRNVEFLIIPFIDKDGVENGEQGKNRIPRDHNRDYDNQSIYNSTRALRTMVPNWSGGKVKIALDLHCPWIKGKRNEDIYLVGNSDSTIEKNQIVFSKLLEKNSIGEIKLNHSNFLPYGVGWNSDKNFTAGTSFSRWINCLEGISLSSTLEFPYANVSGIPVSKDGARIFGKAIAYSIQEYLQLIK